MEYFVRNDIGNEFRFKVDLAHLPSNNAGALADVYTTYNFLNFPGVLRDLKFGKTVAMCSDWAVPDITPDPEKIANHLREYHCVPPDLGGYRMVTPLDLVHYKEAIKFYNCDYEDDLSTSSVDKLLPHKSTYSKHPITPYAAFVGLDLRYVAAFMCMVGDFRRFTVPDAPGDMHRFSNCSCMDTGPCRLVLNAIIDNSNCPITLDEALYCLVSKSWRVSSKLGKGDIDPLNPRVYFRNLAMNIVHQWGNTKSFKFNSFLTLSINRMVVDYLLCHWMMIVNNDLTRFEPRTYFTNAAVADQYISIFRSK